MTFLPGGPVPTAHERAFGRLLRVPALGVASGIVADMTQQPGPEKASDASVPSADERAKRLREIGDANAVYGEVGQNDEQLDVNQPDDDAHV